MADIYPFGCPNPCGKRCLRCPCISRRPNVVPVTFTGFINGDCNCSFLNATFPLPYSGSNGKRGELGNSCDYSGRYSCNLSSGGTREVEIGATVAYAFSGGMPRTYWVVMVTEVSTANSIIAHFYVAVADNDYRIDCSAAWTLNLVGAGTSTWCGSRSGVTCQVN